MNLKLKIRAFMDCCGISLTFHFEHNVKNVSQRTLR